MALPLSRRMLGALVAVAAACALAVSLFLAAPRPAAPAPQAEAPVTIAAPPESLMPAHVLVLGDSWTHGMAATERERGYAYRLAALGGWSVTVDGEPGSGYLKPGRWGRTYGERIALLDADLAPDLIVVQGSINDRRLPEDGYTAAASAAWDALAATYPGSEIVVLGPAPQVLPVEAATARIDRDLAALAAARGWRYVSPVGDAWITPENYDALIDSSETGRDHPSDAGHLFLAEQVAAAIAPLLAPTAEAGTELPAPLVER